MSAKFTHNRNKMKKWSDKPILGFLEFLHSCFQNNLENLNAKKKLRGNAFQPSTLGWGSTETIMLIWRFGFDGYVKKFTDFAR